MDCICRAEEPEVHRTLRETLDVCQLGGGHCLGTGNSIANYVAVASYLAMLDEGRRYGGR
jgi:uroporphyrinogen decarboxylase